MRVFFDTNVILYAFVNHDAAKMAVAASLIERHALAGDAVVSTQVLQETYDNAVRKFKLSADRAETLVIRLSELTVVSSSGPFVLSAIRLARSAQISIWDALMVAAAAESGCVTLYTEDLNHGQVIAGVRVVNPFKPLPDVGT